MASRIFVVSPLDAGEGPLLHTIPMGFSEGRLKALLSNKDEFKQRIEFLADLALDQLYGMIKDPETGAASKVAAIRMIMDVGQKMAAKAPKEDPIETKIAKMSKAELEAFIKAGVAKLIPDDPAEPRGELS